MSQRFAVEVRERERKNWLAANYRVISNEGGSGESQLIGGEYHGVGDLAHARKTLTLKRVVYYHAAAAGAARERNLFCAPVLRSGERERLKRVYSSRRQSRDGKRRELVDCMCSESWLLDRGQRDASQSVSLRRV